MPDVVVIGAGAAGLTAGALLARAGRDVVVVEASDEVGGHLATRELDGHRIDRSVHFLMGCGPGGIVSGVLEQLEVDARLAVPDSFITLRFPGLELPLPLGQHALIGALATHWPAEVDGLRALLDLCRQVLAEVRGFPVRPTWTDLFAALWRSPALARYRRWTVADALRAHLKDPQLRAVMGALWPYLGLPPDELSFLLWAVMTGGYDEGAHRCLGGSASLAEALALGVTKHGGTVRIGAPVDALVLEDGRCVGVRLGDEELRAPWVVVAADVNRLVAPASARVARRAARERVSGGAWAMAVEVDRAAVARLPLEAHHHAQWDDRVPVIVTVPTHFDPTLSPQGRAQVVLKVVLTGDRSWTAEQAEAVLAPHAPASARPLGAPWFSGPAYGWASTADNCGPSRLAQWVGVDGLVLAGHWTQPGPGVSTVVASGIRAARTVLGGDLRAGAGM